MRRRALLSSNVAPSCLVFVEAWPRRCLCERYSRATRRDDRKCTTNNACNVFRIFRSIRCVASTKAEASSFPCCAVEILWCFHALLLRLRLSMHVEWKKQNGKWLMKRESFLASLVRVQLEITFAATDAFSIALIWSASNCVLC